MTQYTQVPGELNIIAIHGDDLEIDLDFDINLSGYTFSAKVVKVVTNDLLSLTVTPIDLSLGKIHLSLSKTSLNNLSTDKHHWYIDWNSGSKARRVLAGIFEVIDVKEYTLWLA